jgi:hypothetical protein
VSSIAACFPTHNHSLPDLAALPWAIYANEGYFMNYVKWLSGFSKLREIEKK